MSQFSHLNQNAQPAMVDVGKKKVTHRTAMAQCMVTLPDVVLEQLQKDNFTTKKGSIFQTAILAGIMASKKTGELIPLCHPLGLDNCNLTIELNEQQEVVIRCTASITAKTGVEMEALTG
ncbi:MAG: cyclic pyranopterin monophosphate synthase MoaC, partial [Chitinophagaceae bacterium]